MVRRPSGRVASIVFCLVFLLSFGHSFYLPGFAPGDFIRGDELQVRVNNLSSNKTQVLYDFYSLKYCKPKKIENVGENLGEVLRGYRLTVYTFHMRENQSCKVSCKVRLDNQTANDFKEKINDEYRVHMILDNLPVDVLSDRTYEYKYGFRIGAKGNIKGSKEETYLIHNHLSFRVMYHNDPETDSARIVGFEVSPLSINHEYKEWNDEKPNVPTCNQNVQLNTVPQELDKDKDIVFSYDVSFEESHITSRWDTYLLMDDDQIHWFSIIKSLMIVLFLSGMVAMIMMITLYRDIANYNQVDTPNEAPERTGWILVHGDVFRAPLNSGFLCVLVGTGFQIYGMLFALIFFHSTSNRPGLLTAIVVLWVTLGCLGGFMSAGLCKGFKGTELKRITLKIAFVFPGILFSMFFVLNALIWGEKSSGAVPFGTMFAPACLLFGISALLVFVGSYLGFIPDFENPVKIKHIPRQIPEQAWYMKPIFSILIGGILPFGAVFLFFILTPISSNHFFSLFWFLVIVLVILVVTSAEITVVLCYFQLCSEDYNWWWRAYLTAGSPALFLFLYSALYFFTKLEITKLVSGILYFGYVLIASYALFMLTSTIGFCACHWFVVTIYSLLTIDSSVKID